MKSPDDVEVILQSLYDVMLKKHEDYGPMNIAGAPGGAYEWATRTHVRQVG
jgi:hypothetical protein